MIAVSGRVIAGLIVERNLEICDLPLFTLPLFCPTSHPPPPPHPPSSVFIDIHIIYRSGRSERQRLHGPVLFICDR